MNIEKLVTYIFFITPMCDKLYIGAVSVSQIILIIALFLVLLNPKRRPVKLDHGMLFVAILVILHSLYFYFSTGNATILNRLIVTTLYFVLVLIVPPQFETKEFYRIYKRVSLFAIVGLVYHLILIYIFGRTANPLTFFPGFLGHTAFDLDRPMSFFSEPSHLASYFLPLFIISLYKKDWRWSAISSATIVMSFSFLGVAIWALILVFYLFTTKEIKHRFVYIAIIAIGVLYLSTLPIFSYFFERGAVMTEAKDQSTLLRLVYGFELIQEMDFNTLLSGIGAGNNELFFHEEGIFYNSLSAIIIDYGLILAIIIYYIFFVSYSIGQNRLVLALQICTLALIASSTLYFTASFFFQYTFYFVYAKERRLNRRVNNV